MEANRLNILLADDDTDDCLFFSEALKELAIPATLKTISDGAQLMNFLANTFKLPDILFLDLNMHRKTGFECLIEIKKDPKLKAMKVIVYSTSMNPDTLKLLYEKGAQFYIQKPAEFSQIKRVIHKAISLTIQAKVMEPGKAIFVIQP